MKDIEYSTRGLVVGNYWGGGKGSFPARRYTAKTKKELIDKLKSALKKGSLDSGMGYESLIGALIVISKEEKKVIKDKIFSHISTEEVFLGRMSKLEKEHLIENIIYSWKRG